MSVRVDVIPSGDDKYPWRVRVTTRDENEVLVGVRNLRALTEDEAERIAEQQRERVTS